MTDRRKDNTEKVMTVQEVSAYLKIPVSTLYELTRKGKLKGVKVGRQWRYLEADIRAFLHGETPWSRPLNQSTERRADHRVRTNIPARIALGLAGGEHSGASGMIGNLSEGGVLFVCENENGSGSHDSDVKKLETGKPVRMVFEIPENGSTRKIEVTGHVVHLVTDSEVKTGIQFQNLSSEDREVIRDYVG